MEVYLIRHTETVVEKGVCYGQSDVAIKRPYMKEFTTISKQIKEEYPIIYSSPLSRCAILSKYLYNQNKCLQPIRYDERLKEMNFGNWELKKWDDINDDLLNVWMGDFVNLATPSGESFQKLYHRVNDFIETALLKEQERQPIIIITHAGVIRSFLCRVQNVSLKKAFKMQVRYGCVFKIRIEKNENGGFNNKTCPKR